MGGINFGWLVVWFRNQTGSFACMIYATFLGRLCEAAAPGRGECVPWPDFASSTVAFTLLLREYTKSDWI